MENQGFRDAEKRNLKYIANTLRMRGDIVDFETEIEHGAWYLTMKVSESKHRNLTAEEVGEEIREQVEERRISNSVITYVGQENPASSEETTLNISYLKFTDFGYDG